jgi:hypothetical protein
MRSGFAVGAWLTQRAPWGKAAGVGFINAAPILPRNPPQVNPHKQRKTKKNKKKQRKTMDNY